MLSGVRTIIIGGVAGGMSAATRLRRLDESAEIIVLERSGYVSFANCGLPYHVGGVIEKRGALLLQNPGSLKKRFGIDVRVRHEVTAIDPARSGSPTCVPARRARCGMTPSCSPPAAVRSAPRSRASSAP